MSEELLKAITQLFAIVAKERITDDERNNFREFLALHLNLGDIQYHLNMFDEFVKSFNKSTNYQDLNFDDETLQFVDDWAKIMQIAKQVNQALTMPQKEVMVIKIIELVFAEGQISERQGNLIFYIGEALKIPMKDLQAMRTFVSGQDITELSLKNTLIIDDGLESSFHARPRMIIKDFEGLLVVLRLSDIETYFIKYLGSAPLYLNSQNIKSNRIDVFPTGSVIRGNKSNSIYYSDVVGKFLTQDKNKKINIVAEHVFYHLGNGRAGLQNIVISENGGKLIGIMGASGSGKTTLLNVLSGIAKPSSGRVQINGINIHEFPNKVKGVVGFIPQDDLLMEDLTVFENLYFAARLCFKDYSKEHITELVRKRLSSLGLLEIQDSKVGSSMAKVISGGQRKRLNIGLELLREPSILFVDEPTSGLSSHDSENIMDLLKELALRGKTIFSVIHQPSSDIFKMFDTLLILDVGGFQIYYGNPIESLNYFHNIVQVSSKNLATCSECGNINPEQIFNIIETRVVNEYGRLTKVRKIQPAQWYQYFKEQGSRNVANKVTEQLPASHEIPSWLTQWGVFFKRDVFSKISNKQYMVINLLISPLLAVFLAFFVKYYDVVGVENPSYTFFYNFNIPVYFFMSVVVALFVGLIISAEEIFRDRKILKRERFLELSRSSYLSSKIIVLFLISAIQTISFIVLGNIILEIPLSEIRYWVILYTVACFANMLGLNISSAFNSAVTLYILIPVLVIPQLLLSGVVVSFDKFNPKISEPNGVPWMGEVMASRWAFEALMVTQFKDNPYEKLFYEFDQKEAVADYKSVYLVPALESKLAYVFNNQPQWHNIKNQNLIEALNLLKSEIRSELDVVGEDKFPDIDLLEIQKFDSTVYKNTSEFLATLKVFYSIRSRNAKADRKKVYLENTDTPEKKRWLQNMRLKYQNESLILMVENRNEVNRIIEWEGRLIQKFYPIFFEDHRPRNFFDFQAPFYSPTKQLAGKSFDTLYFNVSVIWFMSLLLYLTLYFDVLKKVVRSFEINRKYRNKKIGR